MLNEGESVGCFMNIRKYYNSSSSMSFYETNRRLIGSFFTHVKFESDRRFYKNPRF